MKKFLACLLIIVGIGGFLLYHDNSSRPPHIIIILIDTLRADKLSAYGFSAATSPEIDALASEGILFERVIAQSSWTRPSIGSLLTSRYPRTLGIFKERWDPLPLDVTTLAEQLQASGYMTIGVTANPNINSVFKFHQGFDRYHDSKMIFSWMEDEPGKEKQVNEGSITPASEIFRTALTDMRATREKPFFLFLNIMEVHRGRRLPMTSVESDLASLPDAPYLQSVREASHAVGEFVRELRTLLAGQDTYLIITSDHGEGLSDHPGVPRSQGHGDLLYESQVVVPLIITPLHPAKTSGRRIKDQITLLDVMPTVLDLAQAPHPASMEGVSLAPLVVGTDTTVSRSPLAFTETAMRKADKTAVYGDRWKYFEHRDHWPGLAAQELQKVGETENGIQTNALAQFPEEATSLRTDLNQWQNAFTPQTADSGAIPSSEELEQLKTLGYLQ